MSPRSAGQKGHLRIPTSLFWGLFVDKSCYEKCNLNFKFYQLSQKQNKTICHQNENFISFGLVGFGLVGFVLVGFGLVCFGLVGLDR